MPLTQFVSDKRQKFHVSLANGTVANLNSSQLLYIPVTERERCGSQTAGWIIVIEHREWWGL
ncbi:hypothetical protein [Deinococcus alpinitundrae]|uniref:hypothetical protein n=1 Tax=Deinococcus alpinitundrae TaxID=468913 RepID=UPI00137A0361|nr:hypothetical protein [Deinococcus alpinitundrae]